MDQSPVSDACRRAIANFERNAQPGVHPTLLILSRAKYDELRKETEDAHLWSAGLSIPAFCGLAILIAERPDSHLYPRWSGLAVACPDSHLYPRWSGLAVACPTPRNP